MRIPGKLKRVLIAGSLAIAALYGVLAVAQFPQATPNQLVERMIAQEQSAHKTNVFFCYLSEERSERTGGHLWVERMVETAWGTVRYLLAIDGKALTADQEAIERSRLKMETSDPYSYRKEDLKQDDGERSRQMLTVLTRAFKFDLLGANATEVRIAYRPDPAFKPQTMEERALHGMMGQLVLDAKSWRLRQLEGRAPNDVNLGFGPFATLRAGSYFTTDREQVDGAVWRTARVKTAIQGKALLVKTIARQQEYRRSDFQRLPTNLSLESAVALAEEQAAGTLSARLR